MLIDGEPETIKQMREYNEGMIPLAHGTDASAVTLDLPAFSAAPAPPFSFLPIHQVQSTRYCTRAANMAHVW